MSSLFYFFKESLQGFARNLSTTLGSIITIFLSLLIIGVFLVGGTIVERLVSSIEDEVSITAYVADDAPQESIDAVTAMIQGMDGVESVGFTTKEQALENFSNSMTTNPEIIEQLDGTNPLPASIDVSLADPQKVDEIASAILALMEGQKTVAEGAGAVPVAAVMFGKVDTSEKKTVCVVSGGNVDVTTLSRIITKGLSKAGRIAEISTKVADKPGSLLQLLKVVADSGANILSINHAREDQHSDVGACMVSMVLETRDAAHVEQIRRELTAMGYELEKE